MNMGKSWKKVGKFFHISLIKKNNVKIKSIGHEFGKWVRGVGMFVFMFPYIYNILNSKPY